MIPLHSFNSIRVAVSGVQLRRLDQYAADHRIDRDIAARRVFAAGLDKMTPPLQRSTE